MSLFVDIRLAVGSFAERAIDLALPVTCAGCYRSGTTLCRECREALKVRLATVSGAPERLVALLPGPLERLEWCGPFDGITRRAIERLSEAGERRMSEPLGIAIAKRWAAAGTGGDALVPVPTSRERMRDIGYDPAELLTRVAGRRLRLPVVEALTRLPSAGPFAARAFDGRRTSRVAGRSLVLVDDVVVSGTTLATCAAALLAAGARAVSAVTVARDFRGGPGSDAVLAPD
jgi:predicted amidophosphoribosyltransferase